MSERIKWYNFVPKDAELTTNVTQGGTLVPRTYPEESRCEARVILKSNRLNQGGTVVIAEFTCQRCEWGRSSFSAATPDNHEPLAEIKDVVRSTANYLKRECPKLKKQFDLSEIDSGMLPPILRSS